MNRLRHHRLRRGRQGLACTLGVALAACATTAPKAPHPPPTAVEDRAVTSIPRQRDLPPSEGWQARGAYDPADLPLVITSAGDLILSHLERYSSGDVVSSVCKGSGFYRLRPAGEPPEPIVTGEHACRSLEGAAASADGTWAVYSASSRPNNSALVRVDFGTRRADTLTTRCSVYLQNPSVSPDGRIAAVGLCRGRDQEGYGLYTMRADGSELREVVQGDVGRSPAAWSPDGQRLVYVSQPEGGRAVLTVISADGSGARALTPGTAPAWSPDGQWIAFVGAGRDRYDRSIFLIRPDGTARRAVFINRETGTYFRGWGRIPEGLPAGTPVWFPDSRRLAFSRRFDRGTSVWRIEVESGRLEQVTRAAP